MGPASRQEAEAMLYLGGCRGRSLGCLSKIQAAKEHVPGCVATGGVRIVHQDLVLASLSGSQ